MSFDPITQLLIPFGVNLASSTVYEIVSRVTKKANATTADLKQELVASMDVSNADIAAETIIKFLADNGAITIKGTSIYAKNAIEMASSTDTTLDFGDGSVSTTGKSSINAGRGAHIGLKSRAQIKQNEDSSISFST